MQTNSIMNSEAGLMLLAEEFELLSNRQILRILLALSIRGPMRAGDIIKLGLGKPYRIKATMQFLIDEGKVARIKKEQREAGPMRPPKMHTYYFCCDEFIINAIEETIGVLQRSHRAYADGFKRLYGELKQII